MAKTKVLDLDKLAAESGRELIVGGKSYPIRELGVGDYIELNRTGRDIDETAPLADQLEQAIAMILLRAPGVPREALLDKPLDVLSTIVAFINGAELEEAEAQQTEAAAAAAEAAEAGK